VADYRLHKIHNTLLQQRQQRQQQPWSFIAMASFLSSCWLWAPDFCTRWQSRRLYACDWSSTCSCTPVVARLRITNVRRMCGTTCAVIHHNEQIGYSTQAFPNGCSAGVLLMHPPAGTAALQLAPPCCRLRFDIATDAVVPWLVLSASTERLSGPRCAGSAFCTRPLHHLDD
jgi:hypothetical protein